MAKRWRSAYVTGKSVKDIINMGADTVNKLDLRDLREVVGRLVSAGNKRLRAIQKSDLQDTPASRQVQKAGAFSTKGKNLNELRAEYARARNFLQSETSTVRGAKKAQKRAIRELNKKGVSATPDKISEMWRLYEELKDIDPQVQNQKYDTLRLLSDKYVQRGRTADDIIGELHRDLASAYEERETRESVSDFFEWSGDL